MPRPSRLASMPPIGVDRMGDAANALGDPSMLRLENLDTDIRPYPPAVAATKRAADEDTANSYLPFLGHDQLRRTATAHVERLSGVTYDWRRQCVITAGGLSGILNVLLATIDTGDEVVLTDPIYVGLLNRVRLAGGVPRLVPLIPDPGGWRLDLDAFRAAATAPGVRAVILMSPSMPTGHVLTADEWAAVAAICNERNLLLIYDAAMERILFDGRTVIHPARLVLRTVTIGSASKELRMIGWRVGWVIGPEDIIADVGLVDISNAVCQVGIAMEAVSVALAAPEQDVQSAVAEWQARRDVILGELAGVVPAIRPAGGWSLLLDCGDGEALSRGLLSQGVAATAMTNWGSADAARYLRFVYANEPCDRLTGLGERVRRAMRGASG